MRFFKKQGLKSSPASKLSVNTFSINIYHCQVYSLNHSLIEELVKPGSVLQATYA